MNVGTGVALIASAGVLAVLTVFGLWKRLPDVVALGLLAAAGVMAAAGSLLVQEQVGAGDWALSVLVLGVLTPVHARLVFGRPGRTP